MDLDFTARQVFFLYIVFSVQEVKIQTEDTGVYEIYDEGSKITICQRYYK